MRTRRATLTLAGDTRSVRFRAVESASYWKGDDMRLWLAVLAVAAAVLASSACADTYVVDPSGGGDFEYLGYAWHMTGEGDTLLLAPGTHYATQGSYWWPMLLDGDIPALVSLAGAGSTEVRGDGVVAAFYRVESCHVHIEGIAFREFGELIDWDGYPQVGVSLEFIDNVIDGCGSSCALDASLCGPSVIRGNLITGNPGCGIYVYHNWGLIEGNEVCYNASGISGVCCEEPTIRQNHVHHNAGSGIRTGFHANISENIIEYNEGPGVNAGIVSSYDSVLNNVIRYNGGGILINMYTTFQFHYNDVYGNEPFNVWCYQYTMGAEFDATMNWWGTTDPVEIAAGISDCHDDPAIETCVLYDPWCDAPGCEVTPVRPATWGQIKSLYR